MTTKTIAEIDAEIAAAEAQTQELRRQRFAAIRAEQEAARKEREANSAKARWNRAAKALRKSGVHFRTNINSCCRGCVGEEQLNLKDSEQAYGWNFAGQGQRIVWAEDGSGHIQGDRWSRQTRAEEVVYVNHGNDAAARIVEAFRAEGFKVEWNGSDANCVEVTL